MIRCSLDNIISPVKIFIETVFLWPLVRFDKAVVIIFFDVIGRVTNIVFGIRIQTRVQTKIKRQIQPSLLSNCISASYTCSKMFTNRTRRRVEKLSYNSNNNNVADPLAQRTLKARSKRRALLMIPRTSSMNRTLLKTRHCTPLYVVVQLTHAYYYY